MKNIAIILICIAATLSFCRCSDESYSEKYPDPAKVSSASVDKMMTGVLRAGFDYVTPNYWRFFAHDNQNVGAVAQTWGMSTGASLYEGGYPPYTDEAWPKFQRVLTQFKVLEKLYNELTDIDKTTFKPYYLTAKAFMYQALLQTTDEFGNIPFSEAGQLPITGEIIYPHVDDAQTLYEKILDDLGVISNELPTAGSVAASSDFINDGNMEKWAKYVNSIRLRAAIRVSSNGALASKGEAAIKEILGGKPLVTGIDDMIKVVTRRSGDFNWSRMEGITDWRTCLLASKAMIDALDGDPRLPLFYDKVRDGRNKGKYVGVDTHDSESVVSEQINGTLDDGKCQISYVNWTSFCENHYIEGYVVTPSEIAFYRAEAIRRGLVAGDAKAEFVRGIKESVKLYARINAESDASSGTATDYSPRVNMSQWTDAALTAFAESRWKDNLQCIYEQLWLHCGIINSMESWSTVRRTGFPVLYYPTVNSAKCPNVPQRHIVPEAEWTVNPNIPNEKVPDAYYQKLFWAK